MKNPHIDRYMIEVGSNSYEVFVYKNSLGGIEWLCHGPMFQQFRLAKPFGKWEVSGTVPKETAYLVADAIDALQKKY